MEFLELWLLKHNKNLQHHRFAGTYVFGLSVGILSLAMMKLWWVVLLLLLLLLPFSWLLVDGGVSIRYGHWAIGGGWWQECCWWLLLFWWPLVVFGGGLASFLAVSMSCFRMATWERKHIQTHEFHTGNLHI